MRTVRVAMAAAILVMPTACYGPSSDVTDSGKGKPQLTVEAPDTAAGGDVVEAVLEVTNPGPEDMREVVVAFARLGDPDLPYPIVEAAPKGSGVLSVDPAPPAPSPDGVTFRFGGLAEGESMTITFRLRMPKVQTKVGNSVQVYDPSDPERARGVPLEIDLQG